MTVSKFLPQVVFIQTNIAIENGQVNTETKDTESFNKPCLIFSLLYL
jgi:hypothetical protein